MNRKLRGKGRPVHKMSRDYLSSLCGMIWQGRNTTKETTEEVTCKYCIRKAREGC